MKEMIVRSIPRIRLLLLAGVLAFAATQLGSLTIATSAPGDEQVRGLVAFGSAEFPEGLTVASDGTIYVGIFNTGRIYQVTPEGDAHVFARVPVPEGGFMAGLLATDNGVYALVFGGAASSSIWLVDASGSLSQTAELPAGTLPNSAVTTGGRLLVTDTIGGRVFSISTGGDVTEWASDELLLGNVEEPGPLGIPVGANGIALVPGGGAVYVAVFEKARIVRFTIEADGSAGEISVVAEGPTLEGADGLTVDAGGRIIVAVAAQNQIVAVEPDSGSLQVVASGPAFRFPATPRFSPDFGTLYVTNFEGFVAFGLAPGPARPALLAIDSKSLTAPSMTPPITPPDTGSAGLAATHSPIARPILVVAVMAFALGGAGLAFARETR